MSKVSKENNMVAVILGDGYTTKFRPLTYKMPKVLLPLLNIPVLEYTMEWLQWQGVTQCYVLYSQGIVKVHDYLVENSWTQDTGTMRVIPIEIPENCKCTGDALRQLDSMHIIKQDFILMSGDTITNMDLQKCFNYHKLNKKNFQNTLMTIVMKRSKQPALTRVHNCEKALTIGMDKKTKQLFYYQVSITTYVGYLLWDYRMQAEQYHHFSLFLLKFQHEFDNLEVARDHTYKEFLILERESSEITCQLSDCQIYICAPEVLAQLTEHFDHRQLRRDFIPGLIEEEMLGYKFFVYELDERQNAQRIRNFRSYLQMGMTMLQRWFYPIVPDNNMFHANGSKALYSYKINNIYLEQGLQLKGKATSPSRPPHFKGKVQLKQDVCIGVDTEIDESTIVSSTVIGRNCQIGSNCLIERSLIMDNVIIDSNVVISGAIIASNVHVHPFTIIKKGSIISFDIDLDQKIVEPHSKIQHEKDIVQEDEDERENPLDDNSSSEDTEPRSKNGVRVSNFYVNSSGERNWEWLQSGPQLPIVSNSPKLNVSAQSAEVSTISNSSIANNLNQKIKSFQSLQSANQSDQENTQTKVKSAEALQQEEELTNFRRELLDTLLKAEFQGAFETAGQEISILKAFPPPESVSSEFNSMFPKNIHLSTKEGLNSFNDKIEERFQKYKPLVKKFIIRSIEDSKEILYGVQDFVMGSNEYQEFEKAQAKQMRESLGYIVVLQALYQELDIPAEAFTKWRDSLRQDDENDSVILKLTDGFWKWLEEDSEEEDEDDEDEGTGNEGETSYEDV